MPLAYEKGKGQDRGQTRASRSARGHAEVAQVLELVIMMGLLE